MYVSIYIINKVNFRPIFIIISRFWVDPFNKNKVDFSLEKWIFTQPDNLRRALIKILGNDLSIFTCNLCRQFGTVVSAVEREAGFA